MKYSVEFITRFQVTVINRTCTRKLLRYTFLNMNIDRRMTQLNLLSDEELKQLNPLFKRNKRMYRLGFLVERSQFLFVYLMNLVKLYVNRKFENET